jgi:hypothetical protein
LAHNKPRDQSTNAWARTSRRALWTISAPARKNRNRLHQPMPAAASVGCRGSCDAVWEARPAELWEDQDPRQRRDAIVRTVSGHGLRTDSVHYCRESSKGATSCSSLEPVGPTVTACAGSGKVPATLTQFHSRRGCAESKLWGGILFSFAGNPTTDLIGLHLQSNCLHVPTYGHSL